MAEVIFINPYPEGARGINEATIEPPLGLGYLAAIAEKNKISCKIMDANILQMKIDDVIAEIEKDTPKIVGISVNLFSYRTSLRLTNKLKENFPDIIVILGGPTPSNTPLKVINGCKADAVVVGEGEETFNEIINNYKNKKPLFKDVNGIIYRDRENIIQNRGRDFIKDINSIPFPAYYLLPDLKIYKSRARKKPIAPLLTSRGCPYQCIYCSKDVFKNVCRMRSPENIIKEIDTLVEEYGVKQIDILDDNFAINKKRTEKILDILIERNYDLCINLQTGVRTEGLDQNIINKMKKAKIWKMSIGVESGVPAMLGKIKKQLDLKHVLDVTNMAKKCGMKVYGFFMIGLPGDTPETMQKTIDFAVKMDPNIANFCITTPFPGTELYNMIKKRGRFLIDMDNGINAGFYANQIFYEMEGMDKEVVLKYYKKAMSGFYFRPRKIFELIASIKSIEEFKWFFNIGFSMIRNLSKRNV
jgi:anaerobic magnesium-protoporphyrin IX monomethyl ester cyclase